MSALFLSLVAAFLATTGARDQAVVARQSSALGPHPGLLATAVLVACGGAALAVLSGIWIAQLLPAPAKAMLVAIALLLSAVEIAWPRPVTPVPREPTRSLGAVALVLTGQALTDATRFLILALAVAVSPPLLVGIGGALGSSAALAAGWALGEALSEHRLMRPLRVGIALVLAIVGVIVGLGVRGMV